MKYDALIKKLEARACGGHPDGPRQDALAREAADAIVLLQSELTVTRKALEEIETMPCSMVNDSESLRHTIKTIQQVARRALPSPQVKP